MEKSPEYSLKVGDVCVALRNEDLIKKGGLYTIRGIVGKNIKVIIVSGMGVDKTAYVVGSSTPVLKKATVKEYYHAK